MKHVKKITVPFVFALSLTAATPARAESNALTASAAAVSAFMIGSVVYKVVSDYTHSLYYRLDPTNIVIPVLSGITAFTVGVTSYKHLRFGLDRWRY